MRRCDVIGCPSELNILIHGVARCWPHYHENVERAGHLDWREEALRAHSRELGLGRALPGESCAEYQRRHGMDPKALGGVQRIPGSDDDLEEQHNRELARRMVGATEKTA